MAIVHSILTRAWMLSPDFLATNIFHIEKLIKGETNIFQQAARKQAPSAVYFNPVTGVEVNMSDSRIGAVGSDGEKYVAIFRLQGALTKADQDCGPIGLETLNRLIQRAANDDSVVAGVFDTDSPGGEATNVHTVATSVKNFGKPFLTSFNGLCCSAAYYIAAGTNKIYAQEATDIAGSIGVMISIIDLKEHFEQQGIKFHDIFADQSTEKQSVFLEAMKGNYKPLKEELLNPYADDFINFVKAGRNMDNELAYKGKTFMSKKAKKIGMIDGVKPFNAVVKEAYNLGMKQWNARKRKSTNSSSMKDKNETLAAAAAKLRFSGLESQNGYVALSVEQLETLMAAEDQPSKPTTTPEALDQAKKIAALEQKIAALEKRVGANEKDIKTFGDDTTEVKTIGKATEDPSNRNIETAEKPKRKLTMREKYPMQVKRYWDEQ